MVNPERFQPLPPEPGHERLRHSGCGARIRACLWTGTIVGLVILSLAACSSKRAPRKPLPTTAEQAAATREQEEQDWARRVAEQQDALAKQAEDEEQRKEQKIENSKLPAEFGAPATLQAGKPGQQQVPFAAATTPVYVPQRMPPLSTPDSVPYDKAFPPVQDRFVRVGIMSGSSQASAGQNLARMLSQEERKYMEDTLGLGMKIAFVSETDRPQTRRTRIRYRAPYLKTAVDIAALLPAPQQIEPMSDADAARQGVDVLVQIGTDLR